MGCIRNLSHGSFPSRSAWAVTGKVSYFCVFVLPVTEKTLLMIHGAGADSKIVFLITKCLMFLCMPYGNGSRFPAPEWRTKSVQSGSVNLKQTCLLNALKICSFINFPLQWCVPSSGAEVSIKLAFTWLYYDLWHSTPFFKSDLINRQWTHYVTWPSSLSTLYLPRQTYIVWTRAHPWLDDSVVQTPYLLSYCCNMKRSPLWYVKFKTWPSSVCDKEQEENSSVQE